MKSQKQLNRILFCFMLLFGSKEALAIEQSEVLEGILTELTQQVQSVESSDGSWNQNLHYEQERPWCLGFESESSDKRGRSEETQQEFNLSDIDANTVRYETKKDLIYVTLRTEGRQNFIKSFKDGKLQNYTDKITVRAIDVDNARAMVGLFKDAIGVAHEQDKGHPNVATFEGQMDWLAAHVQPVNTGDGILEQHWEPKAGYPTRARFTQVRDGKRGSTTIVQECNLADFGEHTIKLEVKGKQVAVVAMVRRNEKLVEVWKNGQKEKYENGLTILADDVDAARQLLWVLVEMVKKAPELVAETLPSDLPLPEVLSMLANSVGQIDGDGQRYDQWLEPNCLTTLTIKETDGKGTENTKLHFHLGDLLASSGKVVITGREIYLNNKIEGDEKLVQVIKKGEPQNYVDEFVLRANSVENMRWLQHLLPMAIEGCKQQLTVEMERLSNPPDGPLAFISGKIIDFQNGANELRQSLSDIEGDCKWRLKLLEVNSKKSIEHIYEFNNQDLDPASLKFRISKKSLFVEVGTRYKEKIIKHYENGEPDDYSTGFEVKVASVEDGRAIIAAWKKAIAECTK